MAIQQEVMGEVVGLVEEIVRKGGVDFNVVDLSNYPQLKDLSEEKPQLRKLLTHVGNVAAPGVKHGKNFLDKAYDLWLQARGKEVVDSQEQATLGLVASLPAILDALALQGKELRDGGQAAKLLQKDGLLPDTYKYQTPLLGRLMVLAKMLPQQA